MTNMVHFEKLRDQYGPFFKVKWLKWTPRLTCETKLKRHLTNKIRPPQWFLKQCVKDLKLWGLKLNLINRGLNI